MSWFSRQWFASWFGPWFGASEAAESAEPYEIDAVVLYTRRFDAPVRAVGVGFARVARLSAVRLASDLDGVGDAPAHTAPVLVAPSQSIPVLRGEP